MTEIIPNWHPIWVHFAIALLATGAGIYILLGWRSSGGIDAPPQALTVARWMLWLGVVAALVALLTGYWASVSVVHDDPGHANMMIHRNWAYSTALIFGVVAILEFFRRKERRSSIFVALLSMAGGATLVMTGLEGAENVYVHGLGVQRLPEVASHEHGHEESHESSPAAMEADDGHSHSHSDTDSKGQAGAAVTDMSHPAIQAAMELNEAIVSGDVEHLRSLMAPDVLIFESGNVESSLAEYESHHMQSDIAFMSGMDIEVMSRRVIDAQDIATVVTQSRVHGAYKNQEVDLTSTETLLLKNLDGEWKIIHIHWSSS